MKAKIEWFIEHERKETNKKQQQKKPGQAAHRRSMDL